MGEGRGWGQCGSYRHGQPFLQGLSAHRRKLLVPPASPSISVATSRRAEEHEGGAGGTGETPAAFSGLPKAEGTSAGRILTPARAFSLAPVLYRGFGDLSWGGASINLDYWDISLNISCLTEDKLCGGQFRRCTTTRQPPH